MELFQYKRSAFLACLARIGFTLVQIGCVPTGSVYLIILQNVLDVIASLLCFFIIGYAIAFGENSFHGIFSYKLNPEMYKTHLNELTKGFGACLLAHGILTTFVAGRLKLTAVIILSVTYSLLMQSVTMHWIWNPDGILKHFEHFDYSLTVVDDHAIVVHVSGTMTGLIGSLFLGRRIISLKELDQRSIRRSTIGCTILGYFLILIGLIYFTTLPNGFNCPSHVIMVLFKRFIGFASGLFVMLLFNALIHSQYLASYWIIMRSLQGAVAGVVALSAEIIHYNLPYAILFSTSITLVAAIVLCLVRWSSLEDNCNLIAIHFSCAFISSIVTPCFVNDKALTQLLWQVICLLIVILWHCVMSSVVFGLLLCFDLLRNEYEEEHHERAERLNKYYQKNCCSRFFKIKRRYIYVTPDDVYNQKKSLI